MFIPVVLLICVFVLSLIVWEMLAKSRLPVKSRSKTVKKITQAILLQNWELAAREITWLNKKRKWHKEASLFQVQVLRGTGHLEEALEYVTRAYPIYPEELLFRLEEGKILLDLDRPEEALEAFQVCAPIIRNEKDLYFVALAQLKIGQPQECLDGFSPILATTQNGQILSLAGDAFLMLKSFQSAIETYNRALALGYYSHYMVVQLGHAYRRLGNLAEAERIFRELLSQNGGDVAAIFGLGACLEEREHYHKAFFIYHSGLSFSRDSCLLQKVALMALKTNKYKIAENLFLEAMHFKNPDWQNLAYYAFSLECQKKWQEAEQCYLKFIQLFPSHPHGFRALAWLFGVGLSQTLSQEQGISLAYRALKLKNDPLAWEILSACAARIGDFERAYQIQLSLSKQDRDVQSRAHRQRSLRHLRQKAPLTDHHILRAQVA